MTFGVCKRGLNRTPLDLLPSKVHFLRFFDFTALELFISSTKKRFHSNKFIFVLSEDCSRVFSTLGPKRVLTLKGRPQSLVLEPTLLPQAFSHSALLAELTKAVVLVIIRTPSTKAFAKKVTAFEVGPKKSKTSAAARAQDKCL